MINFKRVTKFFGAQQVLRDVTFSINAGERVGVVGPNGAGKSTVFNLLTGDISPDDGSVSIPSGCRIGYMQQQIGMDKSSDTILEYAEGGVPDLISIQRQMESVEKKLADSSIVPAEKERALRLLGDLQTKFEAMHGYSVRHRAEISLSGLGFSDEDMQKPFREFSGGWQMRAELVRVLIADPAVLLLDEPSNYLDIPAVEWLQKFLSSFPGTLVLISHDRFLLNTLTTVTLEIANAEATRYAGNYDFYITDRVLRYEQRIAASKNQGRKKEQAERFIERFRAKNTKASAVQSRIKMLEKMDDIEIPKPIVSKGSIRLPAPVRSGQEVVRVENCGVTYDNKRWVLRNIDFRIERGDKIALVGLNGLGKTTLLRVLAGRLNPAEGRRMVGHKVFEGYQSQEFADTMSNDLSVYETVRGVSSGASDQAVRSMLGGFGFTGADVDKNVAVLSGGEKVRLAFAKMLINPPNFLLLDEPTTHLDIAAREALEFALREFEGTICFVSHDIEFVRNVATTIVAMTPPGITKYYGGYDYYHEKTTAVAVQTEKEKKHKIVPSERKSERRERAEVVQKYSKLRKELQHQIRRVERRIEEQEEQQKKLLEQMTGEGINYEEVNRSLKEVQQKLTDYNFRWEAFAIEMDELEREYAMNRGE